MNKLLFSLVLLGVYCFALSSSFDIQAHFGVSQVVSNPFGSLAGFTLGNCSKNGCAEYKGTCSSNCKLNSTTTSSCCFPPLYCISGKCERHNLGSACNVQSDCDVDLDGTLVVECLNGTCTELYGAGDTCVNSSSCIGNLTCSSSSICVGLNLGATCNPMYNGVKVSQCASPNYCSEIGKCTAPSNGNCSFACNQTSVCNQFAVNGSVCEALASLTNANAPSSSQYLCASPLAWNGTHCVSAPTGELLVECTSGDSTEDTCTNAFGAGSQCVCSTYSGNSFCVPSPTNLSAAGYLISLAPTQGPQALALAQCLVKYNCSYNGVAAMNTGNPVYNANAAPNACSYVNCWSSYKKFVGQYCSDFEDVFGSCFYSPECGGFPVWAIVVIVIVAVILILAVVIVIFLVLRRRKDYASI